MLVFPHSFNYRLIISSLVIAFLALGIYTYSSFNKLEEFNIYISQEKKLLENELSDMIIRYDNFKVENTSLSKKLEISNAKIERALDSIKILKPSAELLTVYRSKIKILQKENAEVLQLVETLKTENLHLANIAEKVEEELEGAIKITSTLADKNKDLAMSNTIMSEKIKEASVLDIENLEAKAVKRVTKKRIVSTNNSNRANKLYVEFTLSKNKFVSAGEKDLYIQILNPNNNVVADQGAVFFGKQSLIYSRKIKIDYNNDDIDINTLITTDVDQPLTKGVYFVNVFYDNTRLGGTSITLK